jgi:hypothetical protein
VKSRQYCHLVAKVLSDLSVLKKQVIACYEKGLTLSLCQYLQNQLKRKYYWAEFSN